MKLGTWKITSSKCDLSLQYHIEPVTYGAASSKIPNHIEHLESSKIKIKTLSTNCIVGGILFQQDAPRTPSH